MIRDFKDRKAYVGIISHKRSANVRKMLPLVGEATWYVGKGEGEAYRSAGASRVIESGGLCRSRNAILEDAFSKDLPAFELSDDLSKIQFARSKKSVSAMSFEMAARYMLRASASSGAKLAGVAPTSNAFYFNPKKPVHGAAFIVGDLILAMPSDLRFDEKLRLKEDYDYTLQHLTRFGKVARCGAILAHFAHRSNKGGAVDYRTSELEKETIRQLSEKWPGVIRLNPRRKDEILLDLSMFKVC